METNNDKLGFMSRVSDYIFNPSKFFEYSKEKSKSFLAIIFVVITSAILQSTTLAISSGDASIVKELGKDGSAVLNKLSKIYGLFIGGVGSLFSILLVSLIFLACVKFILNGNLKYKNILSVYSYSLIPTALLNITYIIVYKCTNSIDSDLFSIIIKKVNPLTIWGIVILIIGTSVVANVSIKKSAILFIVITFISIGMTIATYLIASGITDIETEMAIQNATFSLIS